MTGRLVWTVDADDTRRLLVGDEMVTPPGLQVRSVLDVDGDTVLFAALRGADRDPSLDRIAGPDLSG